MSKPEMKIQIISIPHVMGPNETKIRLVEGDNFIDFSIKEAMDLSIGLRDALIAIDKKNKEEDK